MTHASLTHTGLIKIQPPPSFTALDKSQGLWQQIESSKSLCERHTILQKPEAETQAGFSRCERNLNMGFSETASIKPTNQLSASTTHNLPAHCPTTCSILCAMLNNTILDALKLYKFKKRFWCTVFASASRYCSSMHICTTLFKGCYGSLFWLIFGHLEITDIVQ